MYMSLLGKNEHGVDRGVRIALGIALLSLTFLGPKTYYERGMLWHEGRLGPEQVAYLHEQPAAGESCGCPNALQ